MWRTFCFTQVFFREDDVHHHFRIMIWHALDFFYPGTQGYHRSVAARPQENGAVGSRALHFAAAGGSMDVANYLLSKGCSADATAPWRSFWVNDFWLWRMGEHLYIYCNRICMLIILLINLEMVIFRWRSAKVQALSPVAVALVSRQHSLASLLLPHCALGVWFSC